MTPSVRPHVSRSKPALVLTFASLVAVGTLGACTDQLDFDMRGGMGGGLNTAPVDTLETRARPQPDARGVISYPEYQVAVARNGDTLGSLAARIGLPAEELARFNGLTVNTALRRDEVVALPRRVPDAGTGSATGFDIATIATEAIDRADAAAPATTIAPRNPQGVQPIRHKVERGETAFSIARLYSVSVRSLADWNGLGPDLAVRPDQFLIIPVPVSANAAPVAEPNVTAPGQGSATPIPPTASRPLPDEATANTTTPASPNLGNDRTLQARFTMPAQGSITRGFSKGSHEGIAIGASAGSAVAAADGGEVAAITTDTDQVAILVIRHPGNLITAYANLSDISVKRGDRVRRGQSLAKVAPGTPPFLYFEVRDGAKAVDPVPYLQ